MSPRPRWSWSPLVAVCLQWWPSRSRWWPSPLPSLHLHGLHGLHLLHGLHWWPVVAVAVCLQWWRCAFTGGGGGQYLGGGLHLGGHGLGGGGGGAKFFHLHGLHWWRWWWWPRWWHWWRCAFSSASAFFVPRWCLHGLGLLFLGVKVSASGGGVPRWWPRCEGVSPSRPPWWRWWPRWSWSPRWRCASVVVMASVASVCLLHVSHMVSSGGHWCTNYIYEGGKGEGHGLGGGLLGGGVD